MYSGYSPFSVDFLSTPSISRQFHENMLQYSDSYSSNMNLHKALTTVPIPELKLNSVDSNSTGVLHSLSLMNSYNNNNGTDPNSSIESCTSPPHSPILDSTDHNSSVDSLQSSPSTTNCVSSASGGEEVESPPTRYGSRSIKGPKGEKLIKPSQNYIALISLSVLSKPQKKILLHEIYEYFEEKHPYFKYVKNSSWKNSIRHNLSLNECFVKNGRSDNGKGNFWSIHPACVQDFKKGDFRRRQARRRAKRGSFSQVQTTQPNFMSPQHYQMNSTNLMSNQLTSTHMGFAPPMTSVQATTGIPYNCNTSYPAPPVASGYTAGSMFDTVSSAIPSAYNTHSTAVTNHPQAAYNHMLQSTTTNYNNVLSSSSSNYCSTLPSYNNSYNSVQNQYSDYSSNGGLTNHNVGLTAHNGGLTTHNGGLTTHNGGLTTPQQQGTIAPPNINAAHLSQMGLITNSRECFGAGGVRGFMKGFL